MSLATKYVFVYIVYSYIVHSSASDIQYSSTVLVYLTSILSEENSTAVQYRLLLLQYSTDYTDEV